MHDLLDAHSGQRMDLIEFSIMFNREIQTAAPHGFWKLEAAQNFREPDNPSWVAFAKGDVDEAARLIANSASEFGEHYARLRRAQVEFHRVRVVTHPLSDYLRWELEVLALRDTMGAHVAVLDLDLHPYLGQPQDHPEVIVIGEHAAYEILYTRDGTQTGAARYTDPELIGQLRERIQDLYKIAEPVREFTTRVLGPGATWLP